MAYQCLPEQAVSPEIRSEVSSINILRLPKLILKVGLGRSAIYQRVQQKTFPAPIKLGGRAVGWNESSVDRWLAEQQSKSDLANGGV